MEADKLWGLYRYSLIKPSWAIIARFIPSEI
jgi:hypothetical protein